MVTDNSFQKVLRGALQVSALTTNQQCTRAEQEASDFLLKNGLSGLTFYRILYPTPIGDFPEISPNFNLYDFTTANVIVRTMFETYVNMYYIIFDPKTEEEREFRLDLWYCHALSERQKMGKSLGSKNPRMAEEEKQYLSLKNKIKSSSFFSKLPQNEKDSIETSDKWTRDSTIERATKSGFHNSQSEFLYKFLSNYAHSEPFSLMQIHDVKSPEDAKMLLNALPKSYAEMFLALTLNLFGKIYNPAKSIIDKDKELLEIIDFWEDMKGQDFTKIVL